MKTTDYISPKCCEKSKESKAVKLGLYPSDKYGRLKFKDIKPKWYIFGDIMDYGIRHFKTKVELEKCPFCYTVLPDVELSDKYENIADGDEEYCDTCEERHMACNCYPPEYRWKEI
tara:strand:- start:4018 stop:4365 length:348 start_codon:yes stop_codon:yes gene_type:complete